MSIHNMNKYFPCVKNIKFWPNHMLKTVFDMYEKASAKGDYLIFGFMSRLSVEVTNNKTIYCA